MLPAEDGALGAWLVSGPISDKVAEQLDPSRSTLAAGGSVGGLPWVRFVPMVTAGVDLAKRWKIPAGVRRQAMLGAEIVAERDTAAWLMVAVDGGLEAFVDGASVFVRDKPGPRAETWDFVPLRLAAGTHAALLRLRSTGGKWPIAIRLLDQRTLSPPLGCRMRLTLDPAGAALVEQTLIDVRLHGGLTANGYAPTVTLPYSSGVPLGTAAKWRLRARIGTHVVADRDVPPSTAATRIELGRLDFALPDLGKLSVDLTSGALRAHADLAISARAPGLLERASKLNAHVPGTHPSWSAPDLVAAALDRARERLERADETTQLADLSNRVREFATLLDEIDNNPEPVTRPGIHRLAIYSPADGRPDPFLLHVPANFAASGRYPLVVVLHGYDGTPEGVLSAFLGKSSGPPHPRVDGFVVAPDAHSNSFYRGAGELDVMGLVQRLVALYPIDPDRISITGVSMGGTGASRIGLRYAGSFAAAAPLCGYHSFFIRKDTRDRPKLPWEILAMENWSPVSWAERGRNLPMYVAQGTRDLPLENGRVLIDRYRALGYHVEEEWPDIGHHVWDVTYLDARLWPWLSTKRHDPHAPHVTLQTDSLRFGTQDWVTVTSLGDPGAMGRLDARVTSPTELTVTATQVRSFRVARAQAKLSETSPVTVAIGGQRLRFDAGVAVELSHPTNGAWQKGQPRTKGRHKIAGIEGPVADVFMHPLIAVYGTGEPALERASREVALALTRFQSAADVRYPILRDTDVDPKLVQDYSMILVGSPRSNRWIEKYERRLPIRVQGDAVVAGKWRTSDPEAGALFVFPNPDFPNQYLLIVEAPTAPGLWRALSLPRLLADYAVYDSRIAPAGAGLLTDPGTLVAAGYFRDDWTLP